MKTMSAKRITSGSYEYRGWIINRIEKLQGEWVAYREDDSSWVLDPMPTLRETKEAIDHNPNPAKEDTVNIREQLNEQLRWGNDAESRIAALVADNERLQQDNERMWNRLRRAYEAAERPDRPYVLWYEAFDRIAEMEAENERLKSAPTTKVGAWISIDGGESFWTPVVPKERIEVSAYDPDSGEFSPPSRWAERSDPSEAT